MSTEYLRASATLLAENANADIWYDARDYGDTEKASQIEATQSAMTHLGDAVPLMLDSLKDAESALAGHPEADKGNSKVHFALHKIRAALKAGG